METNSALLGQTHAAFRFVVEIGQDKVAAFTECTLPVLDWQIEELKEGGQNMFVHQLPGPRKTALNAKKWSR
ncbi:MAG: phage tail protein [Caldilineaceae bacterium]